MQKPFPSNRLEEFGCLAQTDIEQIGSIGGPLRHYPKGATVREEGTRDRSVYLLVEGWALSCVTLLDGDRQVLKLHLPGDMLGSTSMCVDRAIDTVTALTPVAVRKVPLSAIGSLMAGSARIATYMLLSAQKERIALMDRLAWLGRSSSTARMASFLSDLNSRLTRIGMAVDNRFYLPMTQEQVGDLLGFTSVHVNRTLRKLTDSGLIEREKQIIHIPDIFRLEAASALPQREMSHDISWFDPGE